MRHSKPLPQYTSDYVHFYPTGYIELSAERETEKGTRYIDVNLSLAAAQEIQKTLNFAEKYNQPLGHSFWHIHNNEKYPCSSCNHE